MNTHGSERTAAAARLVRETASAVRTRVQDHRTSVIAGGVAFFLLLALVPAMIAAVSVFGLVVPPSEVSSALEPITDALPDDAANLVDDQLSRVTRSSGTGLGFGLVLSVTVALWAMSSAVKALVGAVNLSHEAREQRGFLRLRGLSLGLSLLALAGLAVLVLLEIVTAQLGGALRGGYEFLRPLLFALGAFGWLSVLYRLGPSRRTERGTSGWIIASAGALMAVILMTAAALGFTVYVQNFGSYNETYGSLGAVIVLMLLLYVTSLSIVLGSEVDAELDESGAGLDGVRA